MAKQIINVGTSPNDRSGDSLRLAFQKINANFGELYTTLDGFDLLNSIPSLLGNTGKFLTNDGTNLEWETLTIPSGSSITANGHVVSVNINGEVTVDGSPLSVTAEYQVPVDHVPPGGAATGDLWFDTESGRLYIYYDSSWVDANPKGQTGSTIPNQNTNAGKFLTTDGSNLSWGSFGSVGTSIIPSADSTYDLGSPEKQWRSLYVSTNTIYINGIPLSIDEGGSLTVDGNPVGGGGEANLDNIKISGSTIGTKDDPTTGGWGGYNLYLDPGQESNAYIFIPGVTSQQGGSALQIANRGAPNSITQVFGRGGVQFVTNDGNDEKVSEFTTNGQLITSSVHLLDQAAPLDIWTSEEITFVHSDYGEEVDEIDTGLSITRGVNQGIYNSALEPGWDDTWGDPDGRGSPKGTVWNDDGWDDLTNLDQRTYETFYATMGGQIGNNVLPRLFIMKDVANSTYYKIDFTVWGNANSGAPVTYTRQQVDPTTGEDIGELVTFAKPGYADPFLVFDNISAEVKISRASNASIFNTVSEQGYNSNWPGDGDGENSPEGTEWNIDGWLDLTDVKQRTYKSFLEIFDWSIGTKIVGTECVMHDIANDKYYAIKFTQWTGGGNGGGFAYRRRQINADVVFVHTEDGDEIDIIVPNEVGITRGNGGAIYNYYDEGSWDDQISPGGTEWNFDGNHDLSDVEIRSYRTFWEAVQFWGIGWKIEGKEAVMRVTSTGDYYTIKFLNWQQGGGGAFSYIRTAVDLTKVNEGIRFADGTVQKTAANNQVKFKGPLGRRIEEYYGYEQVDITQAQEYTLTTTLRGNYNNSDYVQINLPDEQTATQVVNNIMRNASISFDDGVTWIPLSGNSGGWGQWPPGSWYASRYTLNGVRITYTDGQPIKFKYWRNGEPKLWFDPEKSPGGAGNFRGAIIDYHAYCDNAGTVIGQIIVSNDAGDFNVTHTESTSGGSNLPQVVLWHSDRNTADYNWSQSEGKLYAYRVDGDNETVKIQWKATMFYGTEFWD